MLLKKIPNKILNMNFKFTFSTKYNECRQLNIVIEYNILCKIFFSQNHVMYVGYVLFCIWRMFYTFYPPSVVEEIKSEKLSFSTAVTRSLLCFFFSSWFFWKWLLDPCTSASVKFKDPYIKYTLCPGFKKPVALMLSRDSLLQLAVRDVRC